MFEKLSAIITERKQKRGLYLQVEAALVLKYFYELVEKGYGRELAANLDPVSLQNGILRVRCASSQLIASLRLQERDLLIGLQEKFGPGSVQKIQYFLGQKFA
jgi:predicted nucleic acid-binding Zn ribbon protein